MVWLPARVKIVVGKVCQKIFHHRRGDLTAVESFDAFRDEGGWPERDFATRWVVRIEDTTKP